ncbi:hypothetical protein X777_16494 [Ooceraea biroi]|uniref:Uncharacterized protein n=1 Tax=Ooceraea biroi TaxID=2015173 RepID=A0A026VU25_OOCBI|nr:hypothetical protein X777_16494 [Ooceraea biroi]
MRRKASVTSRTHRLMATHKLRMYTYATRTPQAAHKVKSDITPFFPCWATRRGVNYGNQFPWSIWMSARYERISRLEIVSWLYMAMRVVRFMRRFPG